ncbi:hypothetical protein Pfo_028572 [Paulownia fortunei]|nr:hypothetical protein Pfo_028572 [Paulownia fortunei]
MADPANTKLGRMLLDEITPVVMVLRTPLVEETASDQPYRLRRFKLRLFYASEIRQPNTEATKERLKQVITHAGNKDISELCSDPPDIESLIARVCASWFQNFNKELVDAVSFSEHEAFDHPVACLVAVSSKDKDPIDKFVDLFNTNQIPSLLNDGAMDPKILKYFLLVHDNQDDMLEKATGILTEMRSTFGANGCRLLCINSSADGGRTSRKSMGILCKATPAYFSFFQKNSASNNKQLGCFLNVDDIEELRNTVHDLSSKHIIPHMELKIRILNQQVSATRKGFRNQIKNLWWRKGKDDAPENPNGPVYTFSSTESQIRVLGDYAFMLRDYELALSNYRLISMDYKLDKAWKHYAGVQEMMGLAYFMLDQSRKDAEYCMENAFSTYLKIGSSGGRNVTRCGIWWAEMLKARDQFKDAAGVYFRISGEVMPIIMKIKLIGTLHSAVMLEQASYCFLLSTPTMLRKYGFHLVLSGDLYKKCDQIKHAIRTYRGALSVFKGTAWSHIRDHVHFHIGKWYAFLGMFDEAIKHVLEVLACGHQSKATQELFLRDFFRIMQASVACVNFPLIKVFFEDHRTYASPAAASVRESLWQSLEDDMIPSLSVMKTNWLESQAKVLPKKYKESNVCVAGEAIKVDISFRNPLQIPLSISNVSLICKHSAEFDETGSDANGSLIDYQNDKELRTVSISGDFSLDTSLYVLSEVDISMQGGETILVQLTVTPKTEGTLKVVGVRWKLSGSVIGICNFHSDIIRKKVAKGKRKPKQSVKDNLQFLVIKNMKMRISHPRFLNIAAQKKQANSSHSCTQADAAKAANSIFVFPETTASSWETPLKWPLWFRAAAAGSMSLYITIYYEMEDGSSPCPSRLQEFLVRMDVVNRTSSESFQVHQLSCVGDQWELALLQPIDSLVSLEFLMAGQALSCFFKLKNRRTRRSTEDNTSSLATSGRADVRLVDTDSRGLFDTSTSPFTLFHHHERLHQRQEQGHGSTVDFILISESQSDSNAGLPRTSEVFSHHTCHAVSGNELGWYDTSQLSEIKVTSDVMGTRVGKTLSPESVSPFIWSGSSSTLFNLEPLSSAEVPLQISVFSPGTFDLSTTHCTGKLYLLVMEKMMSMDLECRLPVNHSDSMYYCSNRKFKRKKFYGVELEG